MLFIQHSMLFCWNSFEISALESGLISALMPRVGMAVQVQIPASDRGEMYNRGEPYNRGETYNRGESSVMQRRREGPVVVVNSNITPHGGLLGTGSLIEGSLLEGEGSVVEREESLLEGSQFDHSIEGAHLDSLSGGASPVLDAVAQRSIHAAARAFTPSSSSSSSSSSSLLRGTNEASPWRGSFHPISPHNPATSTPITNPMPISSPGRSPVSTRTGAMASPHSTRTRAMASPLTSPFPPVVPRDIRERRVRRISGGILFLHCLDHITPPPSRSPSSTPLRPHHSLLLLIPSFYFIPHLFPSPSHPLLPTSPPTLSSSLFLFPSPHPLPLSPSLPLSSHLTLSLSPSLPPSQVPITVHYEDLDFLPLLPTQIS